MTQSNDNVASTTTTATKGLLDALAALKLWRAETTTSADAMHDRLDCLSSCVQQQALQAAEVCRSTHDNDERGGSADVATAEDDEASLSGGAHASMHAVTRLSAQLDAVRAALAPVVQGHYLVADAAAPPTSPHNLSTLVVGAQDGDVLVLRPGEYTGGALQLATSGITIAAGTSDGSIGGTPAVSRISGSSACGGAVLAAPCLTVLPSVQQLHVKGCALGGASSIGGNNCSALHIAVQTSGDSSKTGPGPTLCNRRRGGEGTLPSNHGLLFEGCSLTSSKGVAVSVQLLAASSHPTTSTPATATEDPHPTSPVVSTIITFRRCRFVTEAAFPVLRIRCCSSSGDRLAEDDGTHSPANGCAKATPRTRKQDALASPDVAVAVQLHLEDCELVTTGGNSVIAIEGFWLDDSIRVVATRSRFIGGGGVGASATNADIDITAPPVGSRGGGFPVSTTMHAIECTVDCNVAAFGAGAQQQNGMVAGSPPPSAVCSAPPLAPLFAFDATTAFVGCAASVVGVHLRNHRHGSSRRNELEPHEAVALGRRLVGSNAPHSVVTRARCLGPAADSDPDGNAAAVSNTGSVVVPTVEYVW